MSCIDPDPQGQDRDNYIWVRDAQKNNLVVGSQARILYQNGTGRVRIPWRFFRRKIILASILHYVER